MFRIGFSPFDHTQVEIVGVFFGVFRTLPFRQFGAAGGIRQHRMFHHILRNRLDQRVIRHSLHENSAVVMFRRSGHVHLQRKRVAFLF